MDHLDAGVDGRDRELDAGDLVCDLLGVALGEAGSEAARARGVRLDDQQVRAETADFVHDGFARAGPDRHDQNHRRDADHDAERRQAAAQRICTQRLAAEPQRLDETHALAANGRALRAGRASTRVACI